MSKDFYSWVKEKFKFQVFMLAVTGLALLLSYFLAKRGERSE